MLLSFVVMVYGLYMYTISYYIIIVNFKGYNKLLFLVISMGVNMLLNISRPKKFINPTSSIQMRDYIINIDMHKMLVVNSLSVMCINLKMYNNYLINYIKSGISANWIVQMKMRKNTRDAFNTPWNHSNRASINNEIKLTLDLTLLVIQFYACIWKWKTYKCWIIESLAYSSKQW